MRIASLFSALAATAVSAQPVQIQVDAGRVAGYRLPSTVYGSFLEPIGSAIYGGLWAQSLVNPSFVDNLRGLAPSTGPSRASVTRSEPRK